VFDSVGLGFGSHQRPSEITPPDDGFDGGEVPIGGSLMAVRVFFLVAASGGHVDLVAIASGF
jgi:hypothetical protein